MFIEFDLPIGQGGNMATAYALQALEKEIKQWAEHHGVSYKTKTHKNRLRLCLERDEQYTFFQLSWNPRISYFSRYRTVEKR